MGILYTETTIGYAVAGVAPLMPPVIGIPAENYYKYEVFFQIPVFVLGRLAASGLALLAGRLFRGVGKAQVVEGNN
jgi:hypothetical protein